MKLSLAKLGALFKRKAAPTLSAVPSSSGFFGAIRESFTGAWQQNVTIDPPKTLLSFSAVYACVTIIAADIAKLRPRLMQYDEQKIWREVTINSPYIPVLRKPNHYQNRIELLTAWIVSRLLWGNAYVLKERDGRGIVTGLYVLDPSLVSVLVASSGDVYYQLRSDNLSGVKEPVTVPASEIIHDRNSPLWHPLVGVSPLYACASAASLGNRITTQGNKFFENMSRPSGLLTAPGVIADETAARLKKYWEENYSGGNLGRLAVLGDGLKYEAMTIPANDAQLIEQLKFTVEDVARAFHMPLHKLAAGPTPTYNNVEALTQAYYSDCLQIIIESVELCLDEGLALPTGYGVELDIDGLMRMDSAARIKSHSDAIGGGWLSPNEARRKENLAPVEGGDTPYLQQQNWSLAALAKRDKEGPQPAPAAAPPPGAEDGEGEGVDDELDDERDDGDEAAEKFLALLSRNLEKAVAEVSHG